MSIAAGAAVSLVVGALPADAAAAPAGSVQAPAVSASSTRVGPYLHDTPKVTPSRPRKAARVSVAAPAATAGQELPQLRTETTRTYATDTPGELETRAYAEPVHYRGRDGAWKDITTTLARGGDGRYDSTANAFHVSIAERADAAAVTDVDLGGGLGVSWGLGPADTKIATKAPAAVKGSTATFAGALPGVDLMVSSTATGVKEDLVLAGADVPTTYTFPLHLKGLTPTLDKDGSVALTDKGGLVQASIPKGWMADAAGAVSSGVSYALLPAATSGAAEGDPVLQVSVDPDWLADPARAFPVTVDPSLVANAPTDDTYVQSTATTTDFSTSPVLKVGQSSAGGPVFHSYLHFDVSSLRGMYINYANVYLYTTKSASCTASTVNAFQATASWSGASVRWPGPSTNTQIGSQPVAGGVSGCASAWSSMAINQAVRRWTTLDPAISQPNYGLMLDAASDVDPAQYHEFASADTAGSGTAPYIKVNWRQPLLGQADHYTMKSTKLTDDLDLSVNAANGNVVLGADDVSVPGKNGTDLEVSRYYNSEDDNTRKGAPGTRWTLSGGQDIRLSVAGMDQSATFEGPTGLRQVFYWSRATNTYDPPVGLNATLTKNSTTAFDYTVTYNDSGLAYRFTGDPALKSVTDPNGNTITYGYDANGRATTITDTRGGVTKLAYDTNGLLTSITDPFGRATTYTYTGTDLATATDPAGLVTKYGYDTSHTLTSVTDPRGGLTALAYDPSGRIAAITWADSSSTRPDVTKYVYPSATQTQVTDPRGNTTNYFFTSDGRGTVSEVDDPRGLGQTYAYDSLANVVKYTNTEGGSGQIGYKGLSHDVASTQSPTGAASSASYGSLASRPTQTTNSRGVVTQNTWKNSDQLTSSTTGGVTTGATYLDATSSCPGAPATSTNGKGGVTAYTYDARCRLVTTTPPAPLGKTTQTWDSLDRLASVTDADGRRRVYTYDADDRVTRVDYYATGAAYSTSSDRYTFDANGNTTQEVDYDNAVTRTSTFTLDALNRVTAETLPRGSADGNDVSGGTYTNTYGYDTAGNLSSLTTPAGTTTYIYDSINRPKVMTPPTTPAINFGYYEDTYTEIDFPNQVTQTGSYDKDGRLQEINHYFSDGGVYTGYADWKYNYTNPATGADTDKIYSYSDASRNLTQTYTYDDLGRVTASKGVSNGDTFDDYAYAYDSDGNRTSWTTFGTPSTAAYNTADQMTTRTYNNGPTVTYTYDAAGAQTASSQGDAYTYDARGRTATTQPYGAVTRSMTYTGAGNTDRLAANGKTFTDSTLGVTTQTDATGTTQYLRAPNGDVLGQVGPDGQAWYYLTNHEDSITAITNAAGQEVNSFGYGPYGEYDYGSDGIGPVVNWKYIGAYTDSDTVSGATLYHLGARYYNPDTGRFTEPDPSGQEANSYLYSHADPVNFSDLDGTFAQIAGAVAVGIVCPECALGAAVGFAVVSAGYFVYKGVMYAKSHADDRGEQRGISDDMAQQAIRHGKRSKGKNPGTSVYTSGKVRVVVNDKTGKIITKTWSGGRGRR